MGNAIPSQHHPAVVLRSHYRVRALLAAAIIAVVGLTAALVIVANDDDTSTTSAGPTGQINYGGFNPATGRPDSAPLPQRDAQAPSDTTRYDGGPKEGSRGIGRSTPVPEVYVNPSTGYPSTLYDGSPKGGAREVAPPQSSIAASDGSAHSQLRAAGALPKSPPTKRYDGGPEEGTTGPGR